MASANWDEIGQLAAQVLQGKTESYPLFLNAVSQRLGPRMRRVLPSSYVEDVLQETLLAIHRSLHTLDLSKPIGPWINAIAYYKIQDQLREIYKNVANVSLEENDLPEVTSEQGQEFSLRKLLEKLPKREREVLELLKLQEMSVQEVAEKLNMTPSNVKVITFRAIQSLRKSLAKEDFYENG